MPAPGLNNGIANKASSKASEERRAHTTTKHGAAVPSHKSSVTALLGFAETKSTTYSSARTDLWNCSVRAQAHDLEPVAVASARAPLYSAACNPARPGTTQAQAGPLVGRARRAPSPTAHRDTAACVVFLIPLYVPTLFC